MVKIGKDWTEVKKHPSEKGAKGHAKNLRKRKNLEVQRKGKTVLARDTSK